MAYGKKYTFSAISKSGLTYDAEIWENDYTGSVYSVATGNSPFLLECLASGDDPFQPVLPTLFTIRADFTDFTGPYPDLVSTDDKKYYVRFSANGGTYFIWQGYVLMDSISIAFTTGRNFVDIICVDGLGLLKSVPYVPTSANINTSESLLQIIRNCLKNIEFPVQYYINSAINYYATAHSTSTSYIRNTHIFPARWTNSDYTYKNCYDVLEDICIAHGAQIYQSGGEWWITSVNERASDTIRVFRTDGVSSTDTLSNVPINRTIQPYQDNGSVPFYFVENSQTKIIKKSFNSLELTGELKYPENTVDNGNMALLTSGIPTNWSRTLGSGGTFTMGPESGVYGARFTSGSTQSTFTALSCGLVSEGDILEIEFQCITASTGDMEIGISVTSGATVYAWGRLVSGAPEWFNSFLYFEEPKNNTALETKTIITNPSPITGTLSIEFRVTSAGISNMFVANVKRKAKSVYGPKQVLFNQTASNQYKKQITTPIGNQFPLLNVTQLQSLLSITDNALTGFTRFGISGSYSNLATLLFSQLYNIYAKANINMQFTHYNLFTGTYVAGLLHTIGVEDPSGVINVNSSRFILGQCTFDYINNTLSGTAIQTRNEILTYTLISSLQETPPVPCYKYYNYTGDFWSGEYTDCEGLPKVALTLPPDQFICSKTTPVPYGIDSLTKGELC